MENLMKIVKSLEESGFLTKLTNETIKIEVKKRLFSLLLGAFAASTFGNILTGKEVIRAGENASCHPILQQILKFETIIRISLKLMVFIQEIIYLK